MMKGEVKWEEFVDSLCIRFTEKGIRDVIKEFNKL